MKLAFDSKKNNQAIKKNKNQMTIVDALIESIFY